MFNFGPVTICSYNPHLTPAKQLESPGHAQSPQPPASEAVNRRQVPTRLLCTAYSFGELTRCERSGDGRTAACEKAMKREAGRKASRSESLWGGRSADKRGYVGQEEGASGSRAPSLFPSYYPYKVGSVHHQASQDVFLPLQIKKITCTTEINYRHEAGSSLTDLSVWNKNLNKEAESLFVKHLKEALAPIFCFSHLNKENRCSH